MARAMARGSLALMRVLPTLTLTSNPSPGNNAAIP